MRCRVTLRLPDASDEEPVRAAHAELQADGFPFAHYLDRAPSFQAWTRRIHAYSRGEMLPPGWVTSDLLMAHAVTDAGSSALVGRVSIRYELTDFLLHEGGHVGYAVRPPYRRQGYATDMLRQALGRLSRRGIDRVLVTCDDANVGSAAVIEACGGVLEDIRRRESNVPVRRYWIDQAWRLRS